MNINSEVVAKNNLTKGTKSTVSSGSNLEKSFKDELKDLKQESLVEGQISNQIDEKKQVQDVIPVKNEVCTEEAQLVVGVSNEVEELNKVLVQFSSPQMQENEIDVLQMDEVLQNGSNKTPNFADNVDKEKELLSQMLNNDMNINKPQDKMQELKADINFTQNGGEAFSSFLGQGSFRESAEELAEDNSVLSDAAENIAMVNRAMAMKNSQEVSDIKEVGVVIDRTLSHTSLNLTENDINFFVSLVQAPVNFQDVSVEEQKSVQVSERLINMLAESMRNNKAFRLNFDNDISIIIKVSREGRISAHFLPGSDIAENYLKNNLSSLVQRFEEENIPYDELTQHRQKRNNDEQQNKKDEK